jgi:hypothetical protein
MQRVIEQLRAAWPPVVLGTAIDDLSGGAIHWPTIQNMRSRDEIPVECFIKSGARVLVVRDPFLAWWASTLTEARQSSPPRPQRRPRATPKLMRRLRNVRAPRRPGLRPGRAAGIESGLEHRFNTRLPLKSQYPAQLRRQRQVEQICRTPRLVAELLTEIARHHEIEADLDQRLERYAAIDPDVLKAVGGDRFALPPTRVVGRSK